MPREPEPSLNERAFILSSLSRSLRLDSRPLLSHRPLSLSLSPTSPGQATVKLGRTTVTAKISATLTVPFPDRKFDGVFSISTELSPLASAAFETGRGGGGGGGGGRQEDTETLLSRLLEKTLRRSGAVDTEGLCVVAGEKCFAVRADVHVLDYDGGLVDAACAAVVAGLLHFRRPDVEVRGDGEVRVFGLREREPVRLSLNHVPFCVTFSFFRPDKEEADGRGEIVLVDATLLEEQCRDAELVIGMNRFGEVVQMAKYGGAAVDPLTIVRCTTIAAERVKEMHQLVMTRLDEEEKKADVDGVMAELRADNERVIPG